ncbi:MAG: long-chain-fatty-acid--CoA ligase [Xanthobacteraceae bacterium]|nr:long-chain-fatty-acid--CoA ligase [Xanthobacteraceae bacterium]
MDRIWLKSYPPGVPFDVDPGQYPSLVDLIDESLKRFSDRTAFICMGHGVSYRQYDEMSAALAAYFQSLGLSRGARIGVMMPNILQHPIATTAALRAGYTVVNINPLYTPRELEIQLNDSGAEAIVVLENFAVTLQKILHETPVKHVIVASLGDLLGLKGIVVNLVVRHIKKLVPHFSLPDAATFNDALSEGRKQKFQKPVIAPEHTAFLQYTGGTTGIAKGAVLLHRNVVANVLQNDAWLQPALAKKKDNDQFLLVGALPLYHIFALTACFLLSLRAGGCTLLVPNPRDIPGFIAELKKYRVHSFPAVNTLFNALLNAPGFDEIDFSRLVACAGGGMAVQQHVAETWKKRTGCAIVEGYGLSETSPVLTCNPSASETFNGTIGLPVSSTFISIKDDAGNDLPIGSTGEICAKGPQVMAGYWNRPDETAAVMTSDGFFRTGDIGVMDPNGYVKIVDRKKDMIIVSGFNVYPNEVEEVLASHPGVRECAVIGVRDEKSGELPKAFVVKKDDSLTEAALIAFAAERLSRYKVPKHIAFRDELPKSNVGKILRRALRDEQDSSHHP